MKIQHQQLGILCALTLCLAAGCKAIYNDRRQLPNSVKSTGGMQTNDVFVIIHMTNEPPEKVTVAFQATNATPKIKMSVEVEGDADDPKKVTIPLHVKVDTTTNPPVNLAVTVSNVSSAPLVVPVTLSTTTNSLKEIVIPVKIQTKMEELPPSWMTKEFKANHPGLQRNRIKYVLLPALLIFLGGVGGVFKTLFEWKAFKALAEKLKKQSLAGLKRKDLESMTKSDWDKLETEYFCKLLFKSFGINFILGCVAAALMPALLYLVRGDIFANGFDNALLPIVLSSACFASGFIGTKLLRHFDELFLKGLGNK